MGNMKFSNAAIEINQLNEKHQDFSIRDINLVFHISTEGSKTDEIMARK